MTCTVQQEEVMMRGRTHKQHAARCKTCQPTTTPPCAHADRDTYVYTAQGPRGSSPAQRPASTRGLIHPTAVGRARDLGRISTLSVPRQHLYVGSEQNVKLTQPLDPQKMSCEKLKHI